VLSIALLGERNGQYASTKLGTNPFTVNAGGESQMPLKAPIAPFYPGILALLVFHSRIPLPANAQHIAFHFDMDVLVFHPREIDFDNDRLRGFCDITGRLPAGSRRWTPGAPGLVNQFLKEPTDFVLDLEKWSQ
jgi:hypothetical protein